jgi:hypothetical protein
MRKVPEVEHDVFSKVEGGKELYKLPCEVFKVDEEENNAS